MAEDRADATHAAARFAARGAIVLACAFVAWALARQAGYVPIWDGRVYADCIVRAAGAPSWWAALTGGALRCAEHPSHAYVGLQALVQRLAPGSYPLMLATNAALLAAAGWAFRRVLGALLAGNDFAPERAWLLAAFLVQPLVLATVVQVNLDFPVLVCLLGALAAAVERRPAELALWGLLATFSKESGALLYAALAGIYLLVYEVPGPVSRPARMAFTLGGAVLVGVVSALPQQAHVVPTAFAAAVVAVLATLPRPVALPPRPVLVRVARRGLLLALPSLALAAYLAWRASIPGATVVWGEQQQEVPISVMLLWLHRGPDTTIWVGALFVMSFAWIATAPVAADAAAGLVRFGRGLPRRPAPGVAPNAATVVSAFLAAAAFLLTRVQTAALPRYMVPGVPLLLAAAAVSAVRLGIAPAARRVWLAALAILFAASALAPVDPLSRAAWGTFRSGRREHLFVQCATDRCHDNGLDLSVVNLQFAAFAPLVQAALDRTGAGARYPLAVSIEGDWHVVDSLDAAGRRTLRDAGTRRPALLHVEDLADGSAAPDTAWYLSLPWVRDAGMRAAVSRRYAVARSDTVWADGNAMPVFLLVRRGPPAPTEGQR